MISKFGKDIKYQYVVEMSSKLWELRWCLSPSTVSPRFIPPFFKSFVTRSPPAWSYPIMAPCLAGSPRTRDRLGIPRPRLNPAGEVVSMVRPSLLPLPQISGGLRLPRHKRRPHRRGQAQIGHQHLGVGSWWSPANWLIIAQIPLKTSSQGWAMLPWLRRLSLQLLTKVFHWKVSTTG